VSDAPVIGEAWARGTRPVGAPEQVRAWLRASVVPLVARIIRGDTGDGDVQSFWEECAGGLLVPVDPVELRPVRIPASDTVWQPVRGPLTFRLACRASRGRR
jgi:hypothetical protein